MVRHLWHRAPRNLHIYPQSPGTRALSSPEPRLPSPSPRSMDHCLGLGKARVEPDVMKPEVGVAPPSPVSLTPDLLSSLRDFPALTPGEKKRTPPPAHHTPHLLWPLQGSETPVSCHFNHPLQSSCLIQDHCGLHPRGSSPSSES